MTDDIFQSYGGLLVNTLDEQRNAAYLIAEMALYQDLETFLIPTNVTGTYALTKDRIFGNFMLDNSYVNQVHWVRFYDFEQDIYHTVSGTSNVYVALRDAKYGILDINYFLGRCNCYHGNSGYPYQVEVAYNAGFSTGTSYSPDILLSLTTYSQIILNEIMGFGNEAPGDIGVKNYQNQSYRESRVALLRTVYGSSAKAQFIHKLLSKYRLYRIVSL